MDRHGIARETEATETEAWRDLMAAMPADVRQALGMDLTAIGDGIVSSLKTLPLVTFNRAFGFGVETAPDTALLQAVHQRMRDVSHPVAQLQLAPFAWEGREAAIRAAGFADTDVVWAKMSRPTALAPDEITYAGLHTETVDADRAQDFAAAVGAGFGMPPLMLPWLAALVGRPRWRCVVARIEGQVIAGAALHLGRNGAAWLGAAATRPEARGRGAQKALIRYRLALAAEAGCARAHTETGILPGPNPSLSNMKACGFALVHHRRNWVLAA